jgi:PknH-like extracellular domain
MSTRRSILAAVAVVLVAAGCAPTVNGAAQPAPRLARRSLTGPRVERVLLGDRALSRILNQPMTIDTRSPPRFGGPDELADDGSGPPIDDCLGVASMLQRSVYRSAGVEEVALETWRHASAPTQLTGVQEGVVTLATATDANAEFDTFSRQWHTCDGATVQLRDGVLRLKGKITDVQIASSVLAATVSIGWSSPGSDPAPIPAGRAIGVRGNCIVEVEVDFFDASSRLGSGEADASAIAVARAMMDKVGTQI